VMGSNIGHVAGQHLIGAGATKPPDILHLHAFAPNYLPTDSALYHSLHGTTEMSSLGLDLSRGANDIIGTSIVSAIPYLLLIAVVAVTGVVQQRQIQARSSGASAINPQQQAIMKFMPFFLPIFSFAIPSGLVLYFVVSNTYRVGQQWFISRNIYGKHAAAESGTDDAPAKEDPPAYSGGSASGGGIMGWLERFSGRPSGETEAGETRPAKVSTGKVSTSKAPSAGKAATGKASAGKVSTAKGGGAGKSRPAKSSPAARADDAKASGGGRTSGSTKTSGSAKAPASGRPAGGAAKSGGRTSGRTTPAKSTTPAGSRNGAGTEKAGTRTTNAPGSGGRAASPKRGADSESGSSASTASRPPTLQPRARKNKKR
jgi:hypothetical protein